MTNLILYQEFLRATTRERAPTPAPAPIPERLSKHASPRGKYHQRPGVPRISAKYYKGTHRFRTRIADEPKICDNHLTMKISGFWYRLSTRIALFAVLLVSLAPTVSHAIAAANGSNNHWVQVCTGFGIKWVKLDSNGMPQSPAPTVSHLDHCPFCSNHIGAIDILPASVPQQPIVLGVESFPDLFLISHRPLFAWASAQPRAPPLVS